MSNSSICPLDRTVSGATTLDQSEPRINGNEEVLSLPQSSSITLFRVIYRTFVGGIQQRCCRCLLQSQPRGIFFCDHVSDFTFVHLVVNSLSCLFTFFETQQGNIILILYLFQINKLKYTISQHIS